MSTSNSRIRQPADMFVGAVFPTNTSGLLTIESYEGNEQVHVRFNDTGTTKVASTTHIREGKVKDYYAPIAYGVGFMGVGIHVGSINRIDTPAYSAWYAMLGRCYSEKCHVRYPTYRGCSVAPIWHNFQNFAQWYTDNYPDDGKKYQVDKDIKVHGNKIYSPDTCVLVSNQRNAEKANARTWELLSPTGEHLSVYNLKKFCRENSLTHSAMVLVMHGKQHMHKGWTHYIETKA